VSGRKYFPLPVSLNFFLSASLYLCHSLPKFLSFCLSFSQSVVTVTVSVSHSLCLYFSLPLCLSLYLYLSLSQSVCLSIFSTLYLYLSISPSLSFSLHLSVCFSVSVSLVCITSILHKYEKILDMLGFTILLLLVKSWSVLSAKNLDSQAFKLQVSVP
jgi:hypothetical protein